MKIRVMDYNWVPLGENDASTVLEADNSIVRISMLHDVAFRAHDEILISLDNKMRDAVDLRWQAIRFALQYEVGRIDFIPVANDIYQFLKTGEVSPK